jgi:hypothetical protein
MAAGFSLVAVGTASVRGNLSGAGSAADGCAGPVAGAYARLQQLLGTALGEMDVCSTSLSRATSRAAAAYVATDNAQFPGSAPAGPAVP